MELLAWGNKVMEPYLFRIKPARAAANPTRTKVRNFYSYWWKIEDRCGG
jgi:hypothetical protein